MLRCGDADPKLMACGAINQKGCVRHATNTALRYTRAVQMWLHYYICKKNCRQVTLSHVFIGLKIEHLEMKAECKKKSHRH